MVPELIPEASDVGKSNTLDSIHRGKWTSRPREMEQAHTKLPAHTPRSRECISCSQAEVSSDEAIWRDVLVCHLLRASTCLVKALGFVHH